MFTAPLYTREDARRMARTLLNARRQQGETLPDISTRRMGKMPCNLLAGFAARPAQQRTARLVEASNRRVVLRIGGAY